MVLDVYIRGYVLKLKFVFARTWRFLLMQDRLGAAMALCRNGIVFDDQLSPMQGNAMDYLCRKGYVEGRPESKYPGGRVFWQWVSHHGLRDFVMDEAKRLGKVVSSDCVEVYS